MALIDIKVPDIGDFKDVAVIELLVKPGDEIKEEQSLITVESDKASMEIPSSHAGVVKEVKVKVGDTVNEGTVLLLARCKRSSGTGVSTCSRICSRPCPSACARCSACKGSRRRGAGSAGGAVSPARPTSNVICWCSVPAQAAIRRHFAAPTWG